MLYDSPGLVLRVEALWWYEKQLLLTNTTILIYLEESSAFNAILCVIAKIPHFDGVRDLQVFACNGDLDGVWPSCVCV